MYTHDEFMRRKRIELVLKLAIAVVIVFICVLLAWPEPAPPSVPTRTPFMTATFVGEITTTPIYPTNIPITQTYTAEPSATPLPPTFIPPPPVTVRPSATLTPEAVRILRNRDMRCGCDLHPDTPRCWRQP